MLLTCIWSSLIIAVIIVLFYCLYNKPSRHEKFVPLGYAPARVAEEQQQQTVPEDHAPKGASEGITQVEPYESDQNYGSVDGK